MDKENLRRIRRGVCEHCERQVTFQRRYETKAEGSTGEAGAATWTRHYDVCPECGQDQQDGESVVEH